MQACCKNAVACVKSSSKSTYVESNFCGIYAVQAQLNVRLDRKQCPKGGFPFAEFSKLLKRLHICNCHHTALTKLLCIKLSLYCAHTHTEESGASLQLCILHRHKVGPRSHHDKILSLPSPNACTFHAIQNCQNIKPSV